MHSFTVCLPGKSKTDVTGLPLRWFVMWGQTSIGPCFTPPAWFMFIDEMRVCLGHRQLLSAASFTSGVRPESWAVNSRVKRWKLSGSALFKRRQRTEAVESAHHLNRASIITCPLGSKQRMHPPRSYGGCRHNRVVLVPNNKDKGTVIHSESVWFQAVVSKVNNKINTSHSDRLSLF